MERSSIIRKLMEDKGIKVSDISKESGIAYSTVKSILENGIGKASYINICKICEAVGITADKLENMIKNNALEEPEISKEDFEFLEKYHSLDLHGKKMVDFTLNEEWERSMAEQKEVLKKTDMDVGDKIVPFRIINYYYRLASAGTGQIVFDVPPTKRIEIPDIPEYKKADYAIGGNGSSMEPTFHDGDMLLIEMTDDIAIGEIGIFLVDNESYVKKLGEGELISLNPEYENIPLTENSKCMGRVINKFKN